MRIATTNYKKQKVCKEQFHRKTKAQGKKDRNQDCAFVEEAK
jgi:hypothetical protein